MGGCRCTYRSCRASSDGSTHFYHYPVFDKVRCHQWIANGRRFDLLNLKLAQLKNRVVCQHHFRDEMFMNIKKDKLIHNAVPTEDGPFLTEKPLPPDPPPINTVWVVEESQPDINQDDTKFFTTREKMATFSVPYKEFLKKCDLDSLKDPDLRKSLQSIKKTVLHHRRGFVIPDQETNTSNKMNTRSKTIASNKINTSNKLNTSNKTNISNCAIKTEEVEPNSKEQATSHNTSSPGIATDKKITIISEKKISQPFVIKPAAVLKTISPLHVLQKPKKPVLQKTLHSVSHIDRASVSQPAMRQDSSVVVINAQEAPSSSAPTQLQTFQVKSNDGDNELLPKMLEFQPPTDDYYAAHSGVLPIEFVPEEAKVPFPQDKAPVTPPKPIRPTCKHISDAAEADKKRICNVTIKDSLERALNHHGENNTCTELAPVRRVRPSHSLFKPKQMRPKMTSKSLSALVATMKENNRNFAQITNILLQQNRRVVRTPIVRDKCVGQDWSEHSKKMHLYKEISQFISAKMKNDLYEELFINIPKTRKRVMPSS